MVVSRTVVTSTDSHFVDSYDPTTRTVYEFHSCLWHGCKRCYKKFHQTKHNVRPDRMLNEFYLATEVKVQTLRTANFQVVEMWECEWMPW